MISDHDRIRQGLYNRLGVETTPRRDAMKVDAEIRGMLQQLEYLVARAKPRLIMGGIRYGSD